MVFLATIGRAGERLVMNVEANDFQCASVVVLI